MPFMTLSLALIFTFILWQMYRKNDRQVRTGRSRLLDECAALLERPKLSLNASGYARLEGEYRGFAVRMALEEDHAALRKIPSLWLHLVVFHRRTSGAPERRSSANQAAHPACGKSRGQASQAKAPFDDSPLPQDSVHGLLEQAVGIRRHLEGASS